MGKKKELSIYIHCPFCVRKCDYCDFYSITQTACTIPVQAVLAAIKRQWIYYQNSIPDLMQCQVKSIYFGGGTPSLFPSYFFKTIIEMISNELGLSKTCEISCEINPGTIRDNWLNEIRMHGINRISIGVQSFNDRLLQLLNRVHTSDQAMQAIAQCQGVGFDSISLDLMFGLPTQTIPMLEDDMRKAMTCQLDHISAYMLMLEKNTVLHDRILSGELDMLSEDASLNQLRTCVRMIECMELKRYEISNYAKPGYESIHNQHYWNSGDYLGLGPAATSCISGISDRKRWTQVADVDHFLTQNEFMHDVEMLSRNQIISEYCFLKFRQMQGIFIDDFEERFQVSLLSLFSAQIEQLETHALIVNDQKSIALTPKGIELSNIVFEQFILECL